MSASAITTTQPAQGVDLRWTTGAVLQALGENGLGMGGTFTSGELAQWLPRVNRERRWEATKRMQDMGLLTARMKFVQELTRREGHYTITEAGAAAIAAAMAGQVPRSGPKGTHPAHLRPAAPGSFAERLWALLRMRQVLDSDTAASTLVDAGGDVVKARKSASHYLRRWSQIGVVQESAQRVNRTGTSNGNKRYVLVKDCGPTPPVYAAHKKTTT